MAAGSHEFELGENHDLRRVSAKFGPTRTLTAIIDSDPNTGTFAPRTKSQMGSVQIRVTAGSELMVDGRSIPKAEGESYTIGELKPGMYVFLPRKGSSSYRIKGQSRLWLAKTTRSICGWPRQHPWKSSEFWSAGEAGR